MEDKKKVINWAEIAENEDDHIEQFHKEETKAEESAKERLPPRRINDEGSARQQKYSGTGARRGKKPQRGGINPKTGQRYPPRNKETDKSGPPPVYYKPEEREKKKETFVSVNILLL